MFWDFVLMQFSPFVQFRQKYKTSKQHSLAAILKNRQLVNNMPPLVNNASYLLARQPIKMLKNHYLLKKLY